MFAKRDSKYYLKGMCMFRTNSKMKCISVKFVNPWSIIRMKKCKLKNANKYKIMVSYLINLLYQYMCIFLQPKPFHSSLTFLFSYFCYHED